MMASRRSSLAVPRPSVKSGTITSSRPTARQASHGGDDVVGGAGDRGPTAGPGQEGLGLGSVVGEADERLGGVLDGARVAPDGLAAPLEHGQPLGDGVGQSPHVPLVGVAGDHAHHAVALAPDEDRERVLDRLRLADRVRDLVVDASHRGALVAEQALEHEAGLLEPVDPLARRW